MRFSISVTAIVVAFAAVSLTGCEGERPAAQDASGTATPSSTDGDRSIANYFEVGDCFRDPVSPPNSVTVVDCAKPHAGEVYAIFMLPDGPFPGDDVGSAFKKKCGATARAVISPAAVDDPTLRTIVRFPDEKSWAMGDRSLTCIAASDPPRTGSVRR